jgi:hypothetical protein
MSDRAFYIIAAVLITVLTSIIALLAYVLLTNPRAASTAGTGAQPQCQSFAQTNKSVCGVFLTYWNEHGGDLREGLPISSEFPEVSDIDHRTYTVQYFERAVLEHHPENQPPYGVLLSLLGTLQYKTTYPNGVQALKQLPAGMKPQGGALFPETHKDVRGIFLDYWLANGGTLQFGYPISDPFMERSQPDGTEHVVQYFERSVFEYHPENQPPNDVQLAILGRLRYESKYPGGDPSRSSPIPSSSATPTPLPAATFDSP